MSEGPKRCARCDKPRLVSDCYCIEHRREYRREYARMERRNARRLKAIAKRAGLPLEEMDDATQSVAGKD